MATTLKFRRYTTAEISALTGAEGELFVDLDKDVVVVNDGSTAGGKPLQAELVSGTNIKTVNSNSLLGSGNIALTTTDIGEGNNLYYTTARADSDFDVRLATKSTDDVSEGNNLYYTTARADSDTLAYLTDNSYATQTYVGTQISNLLDGAPDALNTLNELAEALNDDSDFAATVTSQITAAAYTVAKFDSDFGDQTTDALAEGSTNLYFSNTLARSAFSATGDLSYDSATGVFSVNVYSSADFDSDLAASSNSISAQQLNVASNGTSGQALLSDGDGSFSWGAAGATLSDDTSTDSSYYPTLSNASTGSLTTAYVSSTKLYFNPSTGQLNATIFNSLSDANKKENIETIQDAVSIINAINPVSFTWKDTGAKSFGVIAQEVENVLPEIVTTGKEGKSVSYDQIIAFLIKAVQQQQAEIEELKTKI